MTITIEAIYENGVLRPVKPIQLAEGTRVEVIVVADKSQSKAQKPATVLATIAAMPLEGLHEPFSGRDHDSVLY